MSCRLDNYTIATTHAAAQPVKHPATAVVMCNNGVDNSRVVGKVFSKGTVRRANVVVATAVVLSLLLSLSNLRLSSVVGGRAVQVSLLHSQQQHPQQQQYANVTTSSEQHTNFQKPPEQQHSEQQHSEQPRSEQLHSEQQPSEHQQLLVQPGDPEYSRGEWDLSPVVVEQYKLIFFTQAKVGCTAWKQMFRRMLGYTNWKAENCCGMLPWNPETNGLKYLYHYSREAASRMLQDPAWTRAIFVRDPKERFLSAYLDKIVQHPGFVYHNCCNLTEYRRPELTAYECHSEVLPRARDSVAGFLNLTHYCNDAHWRPQNERLSSQQYWQTINFVGHMETVQADAERLLRQIGAWDAHGASGWGVGNASMFARSGGSGGGASVGQIHATGAAAKLQLYLNQTASLEDEVEERYIEDYRHPILNLTLKRYVVQTMQHS